MNYQALHDELVNDPAGMGYSHHIQTGNDTALVSLLNAKTATLVAVDQLSSDQVRKMILPCMFVLPAHADLSAKWSPFLQLLSGMETATNDAEFQGLTMALMADFGALTGGSTGIPPMNQARIDFLTKTPGSRVEVLFGVNTVVNLSDVSFALRGTR